MLGGKLKLKHIPYPVKYEEPIDGLAPPIVVKKRPAGHPFQGQQKLHLLSFEVVEDISSQECLDIIKVQGDIALCPGPNLWRLAKRELPELSWFFCFEKRNEGNKEKNYFWKIDGSVG